ncbi:MAG: PD-(D/E)XK nuclease family protein [Candidatus Absconditabacterales bacterium]
MAYSHSKIQSYLQCPLKYRFEKIDKLEVQQEGIFESIAFVVGSSVHAALEYLYKQSRNKIIPPKDQVIAYFDQERQREIAALDEKYDRPVFSVDERDVSRHRALEYINRYYDTYHPFNQAVTDSVEKQMRIEIKPGVKFTGIVDRLDIQGETAIIVDYKTNRSLPPDAYDTIKDQLSIYGLAIQNDYGDKFKTIIGKVIYLHLEREYTRELTNEVIQQVRAKYLAIIEEIEHKTFYYNMGNQEAFEPKPGRHCEECPFKPLCPIYKHQFAENESISVGELGELTIRELIDEVYMLGQQSKDIEAKKSLYLELLKKYAEDQGYTHKLWGTVAKLKLSKKDEYVPIIDQKEVLIDKLKDKGVWDTVKKEDVDKVALNALLQQQKLNPSDFTGLIKHETKLSIGRPSKITDKDIEEQEGTVGA